MYPHELTIPNDNSETLTIWIEPWAFDFEIPPNSVCKFFGESEIEGEFELEEVDGQLIVYGWCGSSLEFYVNDKLEWETGDLRVPGLPEGMSVRGFVGMMFEENPETARPKPKKWWQVWR